MRSIHRPVVSLALTLALSGLALSGPACTTPPTPTPSPAADPGQAVAQDTQSPSPAPVAPAAEPAAAKPASSRSSKKSSSRWTLRDYLAAYAEDSSNADVRAGLEKLAAGEEFAEAEQRWRLAYATHDENWRQSLDDLLNLYTYTGAAEEIVRSAESNLQQAQAVEQALALQYHTRRHEWSLATGLALRIAELDASSAIVRAYFSENGTTLTRLAAALAPYRHMDLAIYVSAFAKGYLNPLSESGRPALLCLRALYPTEATVEPAAGFDVLATSLAGGARDPEVAAEAWTMIGLLQSRAAGQEELPETAKAAFAKALDRAPASDGGYRSAWVLSQAGVQDLPEIAKLGVEVETKLGNHDSAGAAASALTYLRAGGKAFPAWLAVSQAIERGAVSEADAQEIFSRQLWTLAPERAERIAGIVFRALPPRSDLLQSMRQDLVRATLEARATPAQEKLLDLIQKRTPDDSSSPVLDTPVHPDYRGSGQ